MSTMSPELALVDPELRAELVARLPPIYVNAFLEFPELPALGEEMGCPLCGGVSWVSTRIAAAPVPEPRYETQQS